MAKLPFNDRNSFNAFANNSSRGRIPKFKVNYIDKITNQEIKPLKLDYPNLVQEEDVDPLILNFDNDRTFTQILSGRSNEIRGEAVDTQAIFKITFDSNLQALSGFAQSSDWSDSIVFSEEMPSLISWNSYDRNPFYQHIKMGAMTENVTTHSISSSNDKQIEGTKILSVPVLTKTPQGVTIPLTAGVDLNIPNYLPAPTLNVTSKDLRLTELLSVSTFKQVDSTTLLDLTAVQYEGGAVFEGTIDGIPNRRVAGTKILSGVPQKDPVLYEWDSSLNGAKFNRGELAEDDNGIVLGREVLGFPIFLQPTDEMTIVFALSSTSGNSSKFMTLFGHLNYPNCMFQTSGLASNPKIDVAWGGAQASGDRTTSGLGALGLGSMKKLFVSGGKFTLSDEDGSNAVELFTDAGSSSQSSLTWPMQNHTPISFGGENTNSDTGTDQYGNPNSRYQDMMNGVIKNIKIERRDRAKYQFITEQPGVYDINVKLHNPLLCDLSAVCLDGNTEGGYFDRVTGNTYHGLSSESKERSSLYWNASASAAEFNGINQYIDTNINLNSNVKIDAQFRYIGNNFRTGQDFSTFDTDPNHPNGNYIFYGASEGITNKGQGQLAAMFTFSLKVNPSNSNTFWQSCYGNRLTESGCNFKGISLPTTQFPGSAAGPTIHDPMFFTSSTVASGAPMLRSIFDAGLWSLRQAEAESGDNFKIEFHADRSSASSQDCDKPFLHNETTAILGGVNGNGTKGKFTQCEFRSFKVLQRNLPYPGDVFTKFNNISGNY